MKKQQFSVHGTTCKSCEVVIERELKKHLKLDNVRVSHKKGRITLESANNTQYSADQINTYIQKHGYSVDKIQQTSQQKSVNWQHVGATIILVLSLYIIFSKIGLLHLSPSSAAPAGLIGVLIVGVIASLSSCTAVVGGLVAAVSGAIAEDQKTMSPKERIRPHLLFNLGRILGFFFFGALIGYAGSVIQLSPMLNGIFVAAIAVLMIIIGINLLDILPAPVLGMPKWLAHKVHGLAESKDPTAPMALGAMTFFLPCGFTQSMQLFALSLQDPFQSGLVMAVFALGTTPVLLGIGGATAYTSGNTLKKITQFAGVIVLILGISNFGNGLALLGITPNTIMPKQTTNTTSTDSLIIENGTQYIEMELTNRGTYSPNTLTVQEGIPVEWTIQAGSFLGCGDTLIMPAFNVNTTLETGSNTVHFTPTKPGRYTFSCSMGMIRGTMIVLEAK